MKDRPPLGKLGNALSKENPDDGKQADRDCDGGNRGPEYSGFMAEHASGCGGENQPLRGEHAGLAPYDVLYGGCETGRQIQTSRGLDLQRHEQRVGGGVGAGERAAQRREHG